MSEERTKMRDSMADSCVLSMRCSLWDADETRQNTEAIRAALDRYADAVAACENKEVKRAWLAAWDAEYRAQVTRAPLVEALREARGVMDDIASTSHVECLKGRDADCLQCHAENQLRAIDAALAAYEAGK